jgi:hypothetical protein
MTPHPIVSASSVSLSSRYFKLDVVVRKILVYPSSTWFNCSVDKEALDDRAEVETFKWFKDGFHFYTYSNKAQMMTFDNPLPDKGVTDIDRESREGNVLLSRTNLNTTGIFRCEIKLKDGRTSSAEERVQSIYLPMGGGFPHLQIQPRLPLLYHDRSNPIQMVIISVGDSIEAKCDSQESYPAASLFIKINGFRLESNDYVVLRESTNVSWDGIRGIPFLQKVLISSITVRIKIKKNHVVNGFAHIACSSVMTMDNHGFLHQQDSETVKLRVLSHKAKIYTIEKIERYRAWFYGFFVVTILAVIANHYWEAHQQNKAFKEEMQNSNSDMKHCSSDVELCRQMSITEGDPSRRPSLYGPRR